MPMLPQAIRGIPVTALLVAFLAGCGITPDPTPVDPSADLPSASPAGSALPVDEDPSPPPDPTAEPSSAPVAGLPSGWIHEITCNDNGGRCRVHLYDEHGREVPGWPVAIAGQCWYSPPATAPDGTVYASCSSRRDVRVHAFDSRGRAVEGWPKRLAGDAAEVGVIADGTVVIGVRGPRQSDYRLVALTPGGEAVRGWPVTIPGGAQGFDVAKDGSIIAWWYEGVEYEIDMTARRTVFTSLDRRGRALPGWPIGSQGVASTPIVLDDGGILYTSAKGRVWRHDRTGVAADGWPFQLPDAWLVPPIPRGDRFAFIGNGWVTLVRPDGTEAAGWPWRTRSSLGVPSCDIDGTSPRLFTWADDDTLYLAPQSRERAAVVALDPRGKAKPGYPWVVPGGWNVHGLTPTPDGGVRVRLADWCDTPGARPVVTLDARGRTRDDPGTSLRLVYEALEFEDPYTADGRDEYAPGEAINIFANLRNATNRPLDLPRLDRDPPSYAAGTVRSSIKRLGDDTTIDCLRRRGGGWHELETQVIRFDHPVRLQPGESTPVSTNLLDEQTRCLAPGDYQVRVLYSGDPVDAGSYPTLDRGFLNLRITDGS